ETPQYLYEIWRMTRLGAHWAIDMVTPSCSPTPAPSPASHSYFDVKTRAAALDLNPCQLAFAARCERWKLDKSMVADGESSTGRRWDGGLVSLACSMSAREPSQPRGNGDAEE